MSEYTLVDCTQKACAYYTPEPTSSKKCRCVHPEKPNYMEGRCPLYKLDWQKASKMAAPAGSRKRA